MIKRIVSGLAVLLSTAALGWADDLPLPARPLGALEGSEFVRSLQGLPLPEREKRVREEWSRGNVPQFLRTFVPITIARNENRLTVRVAPDYLAIGSDADYVLFPLSPLTAQAMADEVGCLLPTRKLVDEIYQSAPIKLEPSPIPPSAEMTTPDVFLQHNALVRAQRREPAPRNNSLVAGHKKDVVLSNQLNDRPGHVAIHGWHRAKGEPIQPLFTGHLDSWVDYSHGIRLVSRRAHLNGRSVLLDEVLKDPILAELVSDEGVFAQARYAPGSRPITSPGPVRASVASKETNEILALKRGVRVLINRPIGEEAKSGLLVLYALPNGGTIELAMGRRPKPGEDERLDHQHIAAQTRYLRRVHPDRSIAVAYLENSLKSWPAWRKQHGNAAAIEVVTEVQKQVSTLSSKLKLALNGHSGGGSFLFGYIEGMDAIPSEVERISWLDSNYAYETALHHAKLTAWLKDSSDHALCVIAYHDAVALLNGKPFVSSAGGTWGRSQQMLKDWAPLFAFKEERRGPLSRVRALDGRITFWLRENPERRIWHTVQVERNGFIESMLSGTRDAEHGYRYLEAKAFESLISED